MLNYDPYRIHVEGSKDPLWEGLIKNLVIKQHDGVPLTSAEKRALEGPGVPEEGSEDKPKAKKKVKAKKAKKIEEKLGSLKKYAKKGSKSFSMQKGSTEVDHPKDAKLSPKEKHKLEKHKERRHSRMVRDEPWKDPKHGPGGGYVAWKQNRREEEHKAARGKKKQVAESKDAKRKYKEADSEERRESAKQTTIDTVRRDRPESGRDLEHGQTDWREHAEGSRQPKKKRGTKKKALYNIKGRRVQERNGITFKDYAKLEKIK